MQGFTGALTVGIQQALIGINSSIQSMQMSFNAAMQQAQVSVSNLVTSMGQISTQLANNIPSTASSAGSAFDTITSTMGGVGTAISTAADATSLLKDGFVKTGKDGATEFSKIRKGISQACPALGSFSSIFGGLGGAFGIAALPIGIFIGALAMIIAQTPELREIFGKVLVQAIGGIMTALLPVCPVLQQLAIMFISQLLPPFSQFITMLGVILPPIIAIILNAIIALMPLIIQIANTLAQILITAISNLITIIQMVVTNFMALWEYLSTNIIPIFTAIGETISSFATEAFNAISGFLTGAQEAISTGLDIILSFFSNGWETCKSVVTNAWTFISQSLYDAWQNISITVSNGISSVIDYVSGLPSQMLETLGNVGGLLTNAGRQIIDGFLVGLQESWERVKGFVSSVGEWIAAHKGPKSYDLALLVPHGGWIMSGLQHGLEIGFPSVQDTVSNMANQLAHDFGELNTKISMDIDGLENHLPKNAVNNQPLANMYSFSVAGIDIAVDTLEKRSALEMLMQPILAQHRMGVA